MKVADYIAQAVAESGIRQVFMVTGGGAMHLNDSIGFHPGLTTIFTHHEQAAAIAAEGYARVTGIPALVNVTTGPGGINALTGVHGAWTDSIPMLIVSGQVKRETLVTSYDIPGLRQLGDQEVDIVSMVRGITKYAECVKDPAQIRYCLEKAIHLARSGRPGPCWLDIPIDVQASQIEPERLDPFHAEPDHAESANLATSCAEVLERLRSAKRPVILVGTGVRLAGAQAEFDELTRALRIPVAPAWTAVDQVPSDHELFCGRTGTIGDRAGNFAVQNADVLLVIGSRLNIRQVSYNWQSFARHAFKIQVDVDSAELSKPTVKPDLGICADARAFVREMKRQVAATGWDATQFAGWLSWCRERVERYPAVLPRQRVLKGLLINPYHFMEELSFRFRPGDVVVCGNATASVVGFQACRIPAGVRMFGNSGCASMGYDLPASLGAALAKPAGRVICLAGDGSIQMNLQELQTLVHNRLPIKIFVLNNNGYLSMRSSQGGFFGRLLGESAANGVSFPSMTAVAAAYGIPARVIEGAGFPEQIDDALSAEGAVLCDVRLDPDQQFEPKLSSRQLSDGRMVSSPLEDLFPFLSREELAQNIIGSTQTDEGSSV